VGVTFAVAGALRLGAQVSFPISIHNDNRNPTLDYTSTDIDVVFTIGAAF
jgi:hypothetical protein